MMRVSQTDNKGAPDQNENRGGFTRRKAEEMASGLLSHPVCEAPGSGFACRSDQNNLQAENGDCSSATPQPAPDSRALGVTKVH